MFQCLGDERRNGVAEYHEEDITDPDAGDKAKSPFMTIVEALLDDGKYDGPHR
jgi:hypothetical protein